MKKISSFLLLIFFTLLFLVNALPAKGLTSTPTPTTSEDQEIDRLEKLKELIASTAAKKNLVDRKGIIATVKDVNGTKIIATDFHDADKIIDIDELTKFESNSSSSFGLSDLKEGDLLSFIGLFNKETERLLARFIYKVSSIPIYIDGGVVKKDNKKFTLDVVDENGEQKTIDIETSTKAVSFDRETGEEKSGFSKIEVGERILVAGFQDKKDKNLIKATRITHFPNLPTTTKVKKYLDLLNSDVPVSSGSGKKLTPITKP